MQLIKQKNMSSVLARTIIASSCSALLLLGAAGAAAEHHEDPAMSGDKATAEAQENIQEAKDDISAAQEEVADTDTPMPAGEPAPAAVAPATEEAQQGVAEAEQDISEAREDVAEASENVANEKEDLAKEREDLAAAQDQKQQAMADEMPTVQRTANSIIGKKIQNGSGDDIGEISDLGVDWENGKVHFVVVSSGGVMGVGGDKFKVPLDSLTAAPDDEFFMMETTEKDLKSEFSKFEPLDERGEDK